MNIKKIIENIFSITNESVNNIKKHKVITIFGVKIKLNYAKITKNKTNSPIIYDELFYSRQAERSYNSAKKVLKKVYTLFPYINSVCDIGCGIGTWLKVWWEIDRKIDIIGLDGNTIDEKLLYVPRDKILIKNLDNIQDLVLPNKKYDLLECLEVVEHLESDKAKEFINYLTSLSDLILFSAAIPKQGGDNHINEQPLDYWNLFFKQNNYLCFDILRSEFWNDEDISWWYRQNILIFVKKDSMAHELLKKNYKHSDVVNTYYHPCRMNSV